MGSVNATQARQEFFEMIKDAINQHKVFRIHHRDGDVVLMAEDEYESLQETMELLSVPGFSESVRESLAQIEKGDVYSMDEVFGKKQD
jgi:antitoxin YefM